MKRPTSSPRNNAVGLLILLVAFAILAVLGSIGEPAILHAISWQQLPFMRPRSTPTPTIAPTATLRPTSTATLLPTALPTQPPTATPVPPTNTLVPPAPTDTPLPATLPLAYTNGTGVSPGFLAQLCHQIVTLTNQQRARHGLGSLAETLQLDAVAAARSEDMIQRKYFSHYDPVTHRPLIEDALAAANVPYQIVDENLLENQEMPLNNATPSQVVLAWMGSPDHRMNVLDPEVTQIGVGAALAVQNDALRVVFTQVMIQ